MLISSAAVLTPIPGTPGTLSTESPHSAWTSMTLSGPTPKLLAHLGLGDLAVFHRVVHRGALVDELHQILVRGDDRHDRALVLRLARIGRDQIVGLVVFELDAAYAERVGGVADELELGLQIVGRVGPMRLVLVVERVAERLAGMVENDRDVVGVGLGE